ncbi:transcriptional regulator [Thermogladius sp. 4427co]|uniref:transcriptional regulator n=1 Tax=Thermogladius sp. 4427co TaxID=3450718 RepID=UPI003F79F6BC
MSELVIDLSEVPLTPMGKKEIQRLETALIIGTLYSPEIIELLKDPVEKTTWIDSLAVAAASYARYKAGMPVSKIAEEVGRSEQTIRAHINGKTKAGKLVISTYEKIKSGTLRLTIPFIKEVEAGVKPEIQQQLDSLKKENEDLKKKLGELEKAIEQLRAENESRMRELMECQERASKLSKIVEEVKAKLNVLEEIKQLLA